MACLLMTLDMNQLESWIGDRYHESPLPMLPVMTHNSNRLINDVTLMASLCTSTRLVICHLVGAPVNHKISLVRFFAACFHECVFLGWVHCKKCDQNRSVCLSVPRLLARCCAFLSDGMIFLQGCFIYRNRVNCGTTLTVNKLPAKIGNVADGDSAMEGAVGKMSLLVLACF